MLEPLPSSQWNAVTAAHLANRAGFGASPQAVDNLVKMGVEKAVAHYVNYEGIADDTPAPDWSQPDADERTKRDEMYAAADEATRNDLRRQLFLRDDTQIADLRYWWIRRMALGPRPFQEKMTLFWHGHFATSYEKVRDPYFLWLQNETFRQNATGNFNQLLIAVAQDPAMLQYLDGQSSARNHPNENFAREVLELFTLGEGHYTEQDIQQSAKAYTGWGISHDRLHFEYHAKNHDPGPKTVFGQTGNYTGEDVLNMICAQPRCAEFIAQKIWRFFAQDQPPVPVVAALAAQFHNGMEIKALMATIFRSKEFYAPDVIRAQIKSPIQWLVSSTQQLESPPPTEPMSLVMLLLLGQELFAPPNVKGWDGGIAWITTNNLLNRYNFAAALVEGQRVPLPALQGQMKGFMSRINEDGLLQLPPVSVANLFSADQLISPESFLTALQQRFLNDSLKEQYLAPLRDFLKSKSPIEEADIRKAIRLIMSTPEYQLT